MKDYHINIFHSDEGRPLAASPAPCERGDYRSYWISLILLGGAIWFLLFLYHQLDPILMEFWGARSGPYLDEYRTGGAKIWRLLYRCSSSWTCLWLPILWAFSIFLIQSGLNKRHARAFNEAHTVLVILLSSVAVFGLFHLFLAPPGLP
jgi:hypothetical protein